MNITTEFDGVFRFTNASDQEFIALWNNKEYIFPPKSTVPLLIEGESPENIQEIRKRFAKKYAEREYFNSKDFSNIKNGNKSKEGIGGYAIPSMYDETVLQKWVDQCLEPLPISKAIVKKVIKHDEDLIKSSKAVQDNTNLNESFKDSTITSLGEMR